MESVYLLIPVSVLLVFGIAFAFWWSVRSGQFDDQKKFLDGAQFDSEEALKDAVEMERKKAALLKGKQQKQTGYAPPD